MTNSSKAAVPPQEEKIIWEGCPKWQSDFAFIFVSLLISLLGVAGFLLVPWRFPYYWAVYLGFIVLGGLLIAGVRIKRRHERYKLTNLVVEFQRGVFSTRIDNMELWRINDIGYQQNLVDKILRVSTLRLDTQDKSHPLLEISGMPSGRHIYDELKKSVHIARQARNVLGMVE